jgi:hypothetical protein
MTITPRELLDTSIGQLQLLVAFLNDQLSETGGSPPVQCDAPEVRACREVLLSLADLIPKVRVEGSNRTPRLGSSGSAGRQNAAHRPPDAIGQPVLERQRQPCAARLCRGALLVFDCGEAGNLECPSTTLPKYAISRRSTLGPSLLR